MKRFCIIGMVLVAAVCLLAVPGHSDPPKKKVRVYDKVSSVDATANTITIVSGEKEDSKDYKVDSFTVISVNGKTGKLADVQTDMKVDFSVKSDGKTLTKLEAVDPPVDKDKKAKK